ncbi:MAG: pilus assembly protein PilP [Myxococcales bacterium]|nr:pilus assembly protein PilP [Myxococcales bacterium]
MKTTRMVLGVAALLLLGVQGCDDKKSSPFGKAAPRKPGAKRPPPRRPPQAPGRVKRRKSTLGDEDFAESIQTNRDPFRSYLGEFANPIRRTVRLQRKILLPRYGLDELRLIAVVTGRVRARAMFRDPKGLGISVKRGDYISKNAARVKQILPDKVVVQIQEQSEDTQRTADRVIELHSKAVREQRVN